LPPSIMNDRPLTKSSNCHCITSDSRCNHLPTRIRNNNQLPTSNKTCRSTSTTIYGYVPTNTNGSTRAQASTSNCNTNNISSGTTKLRSCSRSPLLLLLFSC
jgi:hypothetical protein